MKNHLNPYEEFANAIVLQAVKDYRDANEKLSRGRRNQEAERMKSECLRFIRSQWFSVLTEIDPNSLVRRLEAEVEHDG